MSVLGFSLGRYACAAAIAALLFTANSADAATFKLKIGAGHPPAGLWVATLREVFMPRVAERVAKETPHKIEWTEAFGGSVCKLGECLEAIESGLIDIGDAHAPFEPAKMLAHNFAFFAPFGAPDPRVAAKAVREVYETTPALRKVLEDRYNQVFVAVGIVGNYGLITTFTWNTVADLKGHKIAAAGPNLPWLQGTGVVGVQSTLNEAYTSMQTGVYEGWVMFTDASMSFKLHEVSKQYVDMDFGCIGTPVITMNKDTWKDLPPEVQKIILDAGRDYNEAIGRITHEKQEAARNRMREAGLEVRIADPATKEAWAKALPNIPKLRFEEINKANMPGEVVYNYIKALKAAGHKFPRDWEAER
jgi:TRAP-type C4-dicarboxylate transport system substrate-binding protein